MVFKVKIQAEKVTVIIPVFNEEKHIRRVLNSVISQDWDGFIEIVIVDGNSTDFTRKIIVEMKKGLPKNRNIILLQNPERFIPVSLNIACRNASSDIIVRLDGHTYAPANYVSEAVRTLKEINFNGIVGGRWKIKPGDSTSIAGAIAIAVSHPFGVGNALYRTLKDPSGQLLDVDTVPFGAFRKSLWEEMGGYDEYLLADEDYDFNYRVKKRGYRIVMNRHILLEYVARPNSFSLWEQYYRYGFWVAKFFIKHKTIPTLRRLVPISFILTIFCLLLLNPKVSGGLLLIYLVPIVVTSLYEGVIRRKDILLTGWLFLTFPVLHFGYGVGNIAGLLTSFKPLKLN